MQESISMFYNELWFIILMAGLGLVLLAIFLGLLLHKALKSSPFARERPPLVPLPLQKRSPMGAYPPSDSYLQYLPDSRFELNLAFFPKWARAAGHLLQFDTVPDISNTSSSVTLKGFTFHMERVTENKIVTSSDAHDPNRMLSLQGQQSHTHFQNSLHRSVSQLIDTQDSKFLKDDGIWSPVIWGHDSGLFMDDEVFEDTIKGFSTVRKEHTMFTDTNL